MRPSRGSDCSQEIVDESKPAVADLNLDAHLRLSGQRALWGVTTPNLRSVSCDIDGESIIVQAVFAERPSDLEEELFSVACSEIIADYSSGVIHERIIISQAPLSEIGLRLCLYQRYEAN